METIMSQKIIDLPKDYDPEKDKGEYMNPLHLEFFRQQLLTWKEDLLDKSRETLDHLREEEGREPDPVDQASSEYDQAVELRTRDRYRKLITKIDSALARIDTGEYGFCEETGEEIGVGRLKARPIATLCIEAQERHESYEKQHNDDD